MATSFTVADGPRPQCWRYPRSCYNYRLCLQAASGLERKSMLFVVTGELALAALVRRETQTGALIPDEEVNKSLQQL